MRGEEFEGREVLKSDYFRIEIIYGVKPYMIGNNAKIRLF